MSAAADRALELDPENPRAMVSAAKPLVFADAEHGGDLDAGIELLTEALEIEPELVSALVIRAMAYERLGEITQAENDRQAALRLYPECEAHMDSPSLPLTAAPQPAPEAGED
jgi:tetratricopeptide (TPR) repeat protein